ncbi:L-lactate dehydrogenase [Secundilactobacillus odoratitofui]|nr:L-lactate dehydrogenase [Secundilactobacillus odoratitofui]
MSKIVLVGDGAVGSAFAYSVLQHGIVDELVLVDLRKTYTMGDAADLEDVTPMLYPARVYAGNYQDAADADIVVITAGIPRQVNESRLDLVNKNRQILASIVQPIVESGFSGCFVVSANPVDLLTALTQHLSGFPKQKVIGTGTALDSARLQVALSRALNISTRGIDAYVLGEHGDSSFGAFDEATINGQPLRSYPGVTPELLTTMMHQVQGKGGQIITNKGATYYGVATSLTKICQAILLDQAIALPVSAPLDGQYGLHGLYLGTPAIIARGGIRAVLEAQLSETEHQQMLASAATINSLLMAVE